MDEREILLRKLIAERDAVLRGMDKARADYLRKLAKQMRGGKEHLLKVKAGESEARTKQEGVLHTLTHLERAFRKLADDEVRDFEGGIKLRQFAKEFPGSGPELMREAEAVASILERETTLIPDSTAIADKLHEVRDLAEDYYKRDRANTIEGFEAWIRYTEALAKALRKTGRSRKTRPPAGPG